MTGKAKEQLLVVMAKAPNAGEVKTRLLPQLNAEEAADLYTCLLRDRLAGIEALRGADRALAYTPAAAREAFLPLARNGLALFPQRGRDLGERLNAIFVDQLAAGRQAVVIVDSDTPELTAAIVEQAFDRLSSGAADVVLGPCRDGGYYLVGMRRPHPALFENIPWSTERVLAETLARARRIGATVALLEELDDLDTFEDLAAFYRRRRRGRPAAPGARTLDWLTRWHARAGSDHGNPL